MLADRIRHQHVQLFDRVLPREPHRKAADSISVYAALTQILPRVSKARGVT